MGARRALSLGWTWVFCQAALPAQVEGYEVLEEEEEGLVDLAVRLHEGGEGLRGRGDWMGRRHKHWRGWAEQVVEGGRVKGRQERGLSQV